MLRLLVSVAVVSFVSCGPSSGADAGSGGGVAGGASSAGGQGGGAVGGGSTVGGGGATTGGGSAGGTALLELGKACPSGPACASGFCVDGVCCNSACTGTCQTCAATGSSGAAGTCSPVAAGQDPANECDTDVAACLAGTCDGAGACGKAPDGTVCRAPDGGCDVSESCAAGVCPSDSAAALGVTCRAAAGACDLAETCDGFARACPPDGVKTGVTTCRSSQGDCDPVEFCDGLTAQCPADVYLAEGTVCRPSAAVCDVAETCTGLSAGCPLDGFADAGVVCRGDAGPCDLAETCNGFSSMCPADQFKPAATACGTSGFFACSGASAGCPTSCTTNAECATTPGVTCHDAKLCHNGKWAFISSASSNGNLGGLDGGDRFCNTLAADAGMRGTFRAWLGSDTEGPSTRFTKPTVPYYLLNGTRLATNYAALGTGLLVPFNVNELGVTVPPTNPWSSVFASGFTNNAQNCSNWTTGASLGTVATAGRYGNSTLTDPTWSFDSINQCNVLRRLYCFEQ